MHTLQILKRLYNALEQGDWIVMGSSNGDPSVVFFSLLLFGITLNSYWIACKEGNNISPSCLFSHAGDVFY